MRNFFRSLNNFIRWIGVLIDTSPAMRPPHCCNINTLLLHLCDFDHELHKWVLRWIAYPLRHPGAKMGTGLVLNGGRATGKTLFFEDVVAELYGAFGTAVGARQFRDGQDQWTGVARFVVVDGDSYHRGMGERLKHLITDSKVLVRNRYQDERLIPNQMNFVALVNAPDFLPVAAAHRHIVIIEAPPAREPLFYRAVVDEIKNGGIEAFRHYLLKDLDMDGFHEFTPPPTHLAPPTQRQAA